MSYDQQSPLTEKQIRDTERTLNQLRNPDLQKILEKLGQSKQGKKNELLGRLLPLAKDPKFYRTLQSCLDMSRRPPTVRATPYNVPQQRNMGFVFQNNNQMYPGGPIRTVFNGYPVGGATMHSAQNTIQPSSRPTLAPAALKTVPLPFYDVLNTIMDPMELGATSNGQKYQSKSVFTFQIQPEVFQKIHYRFEPKSATRAEIQLRFFNTTDLREPQKDDFPLNCTVRIDEMVVSLPNVIPTNKPNSEPKRPSRPVDITFQCQKSNAPHRLHIEWTADKRTWAVAIYYVNRVNTGILLERLVGDPAKHRAIDVTKKEIVKKLNGHDDEGIAMDQLKIALICPLIKQRMKTPSRCIDCVHLQCFDLEAYLQMNEKRPTWICPVCSLSASYSRLIIDEYFKDVIVHVDDNTIEVELKPDGRYEMLKEEDAVELSDDEDGLGVIKKEVKPSHVTNGATADKPKTTPTFDNDIIVLSDSDDDEDLSRGIQNSLTENNGAGAIQKRTDSSDAQMSSSSYNQAPVSSSSSSIPKPVSQDTPPASSSGNTLKERLGYSKKPDDDIEIITLDDTPPRPVAQSRLAQQLPSSSSGATSSRAPTTPSLNMCEALAKISDSSSPGASTAPNTPSSFNPKMNVQPPQSSSSSSVAVVKPCISTPQQQQQQQMQCFQQSQMNYRPPTFMTNGYPGQWRGAETNGQPPLIGRQMSNVMAPAPSFQYGQHMGSQQEHAMQQQQHHQQQQQHQQQQMSEMVMNNIPLPSSSSPPRRCMSPNLLPIPPGLLPAVEDVRPPPPMMVQVPVVPITIPPPTTVPTVPITVPPPSQVQRTLIPPPLPNAKARTAGVIVRRVGNEANNNQQ